MSNLLPTNLNQYVIPTGAQLNTTNTTINALIQYFNFVPSNGGVTPLTINSKQGLIITGALNETVTLPDATTLQVGYSFIIINNSTGNIVIQNFTLNTLLTLAPNQIVFVVCNDILTTAGTWVDAPLQGVTPALNSLLNTAKSNYPLSVGVFYDGNNTYATYIICNATDPIDPTVNADDTAGYEIGSLWLNTNTKVLWVCSDAGTGDAIWNIANSITGTTNNLLMLDANGLGTDSSISKSSIVSLLTLSPSFYLLAPLNNLNMSTTVYNQIRIAGTNGALPTTEIQLPDVINKGLPVGYQITITEDSGNPVAIKDSTGALITPQMTIG